LIAPRFGNNPCVKKSPEGLTKISVGKILGKSRKTRKNENLMKLDEI